MDSLSGARTLD